MRLKDITPSEAKTFSVSRGVKIVSNRNERLRRRGIGQGMLIQSINGIEIQSTENLLKINESEIYEIEFMNKKQESFRFFFD